MEGTNLFSIFNNYPGLLITISTRADGTMKYENGVDREEVLSNREAFFNKIEIKKKNIVSAGLVHGNVIRIIGKNSGNINGVDGLLTRDRETFLTITVADCLPVYVYDKRKKIVGLIHAGWKGLSKNIVRKTIMILKNKFKSEGNNLIIGIGPGICSSHFEVKENVLNKFRNYKDAIKQKDGKNFLDLRSIAKRQLIEEGVNKDNIEINKICPYEDEKFFSYRRDKKPLKTMVAIIGMR